MQKFNTLLSFFACMLIVFAAQAQTAVQMDLDELAKRTVNVDKSIFDAKINAPEGTTPIFLDYGATSGDPQGSAFFWTINSGFTGNNQVDVAGVVFDSLIDANSITYDPNNYYSQIDTISWFMRVRKGSPSTTTDTLLLSVFELTGTTVIYQDTFFYTQSVASPMGNFFLEQSIPEVTICDNGFAVRFDFFGPTTDTLDMIASFNPGTCPTDPMGSAGLACGPQQSNIPGSSFYGVYNSNGSRITSAYYDCNSNGMTDPCESFFIQNWFIFADVSLVDAPLEYTVNTTPDNGIGSGTAEIVLVDDIDVDVVWVSIDGNNFNIPNGLRAENLAADRILIGIAPQGINCGGQGIQDTVEILSNVSIDDFSAAGISSLSAYPNPTQGALTLDLELDKREDVRIQLMNTAGKVVYQTAFQQVQTLRQPINMGDVAPGVYMLNVTTSRGTATQRIVVSK